MSRNLLLYHVCFIQDNKGQLPCMHVFTQSDAQSHIEQNSVLRNDMSLLQEELDQQQRLIQALLRRKVSSFYTAILMELFSIENHKRKNSH